MTSTDGHLAFAIAWLGVAAVYGFGAAQFQVEAGIPLAVMSVLLVVWALVHLGKFFIGVMLITDEANRRGAYE